MAPLLPSSLQVLHLASDKHMLDAPKHFAESQWSFPTGLKSVVMHDARFSNAGALVLANSLPPGLEALRLDECYTMSRYMSQLFESLPASLRTLKLKRVFLNQDHVETLLTRLPSALETLAVRDISPVHCQMFKVVPVFPASLKRLRLDHLGLEPTLLVKSIPTRLETLALRTSMIGVSVIKSLLRCLSPTLVKLELSENPLGDAGVILLARSVDL
ncbi:hypothetical protein H9P43_007873 [Blastocladiella emersonii ATCC 22665]|nr:hypothetical protein H9P43_007873 [Blastocladiella emersonii ATCC 22665]